MQYHILYAMSVLAALLPASPAFATTTMKVGYGRVRPITYRNDDGSVAGFAVDVLTEAARREGIKLVWLPTANSAASEAMLAGRGIDLMAAGMVTPDRQRKFYVSEPWWSDELTLLTRADIRGPVRRLAISPVYETLAKKAYPHAELSSESTLEKNVSGVCEGKTDAALITHGELHAVSLKRPAACADVALASGDTSVVIELAVISRHSDESVAARLRQRIDEMALDGTLIQYVGKYPPVPASGAVRLAHQVQERSRDRLLSIGAFCMVPIAIWVALGLRRRDTRPGANLAMPDAMPRRSMRFLFAAAITLGALGLRYLLGSVLGLRVPFLFQSFAVAAAAQYGGMSAGLLATALAVVLGGFLFTGPELLGFLPQQPADVLSVALFIMLGVSLSFLGERFISAKRQRMEAERENEIERKHKSELEAILEGMAEPLLIADGTGRVTTTNKAYRSCYGSPPESASAYGAQFTFLDLRGEVLPPEMWPINRALHGEAVRDVELNLLRADGRRWIVNYNAIPVCDNEGKIVQVVMTCPDLTERKRSDQARRESEERLRLTLDAAQVGIFEYKPQTGDLFWDERTRRIWGLGPQDQLNYTDSIARIHPDDRRRFEQAVAAAVDSQSDGSYESEYRILWPDGSVHWTAAKGRVYFEGSGEHRRAVRMTGVQLDTTARKRAEEELRRTREEYRLLVENQTDMVARVTRDGRRLYVNANFLKAVGRSEAEVVNSGYSPEIHPEDAARVAREWQRTFEGPEYRSEIEMRALTPNGWRWHSWRNTAVFDENGEPSTAISVGRDITELKSAEEVIKESERRLKVIIENLAEGLIVVDPQGAALHWNETAQRMYEHVGLERGVDFLADAAESYELRAIDGSIVPFDEWPVPRLLRGETLRDSEFLLRHKKRDWERVFSYGGTLVRTAAGEPWMGLLTIRDVTERKRTEQALRESEARLARTQEFSLVMALHVSLDGRWLKLPPTFAQFLGYDDEEELLGKEFKDVTHPDDFWADWSQCQRLLSGEIKSFEMEKRFLRKDGSVTWGYMNCSVVADEQGTPVHFLTYVRDIDAQRRAEQALRESEARYRTLFKSMQEGFAVAEVICDAEGKPVDWRYLDVNPAFESMFGQKREDVVGRTYRELFPDAPWGYWVSGLGQVALTGTPARLEQYGHETSRHYEAIAYRPREGQFAAIFTDVTERKQAEERLRHAQKLESIGLLAGGIAHDFNNLLTGILGNASLALEQVEPETALLLEGVVSNSERAAHLTRQLLAYSGKGQFFIRDLDLSEAVHEMSDLLRLSVTKNVELRFDLHGRLPLVSMDAGQLQQLIMNLVMNAGEAIGDAAPGSVTVSTGLCEIKDPMVDDIGEVLPAGQYVCVEVSDTGPGIDASAIARIFDPFFTTKFTGRGLGLAAVSGIMRTVKGGLRVKTAPGAGTSFTLYFRRTGKKQERAASGPKSRGTVLVVDDEEYIRDFLRVALERRGYRVSVSKDGKDALSVWEEVEPDLVILDVVMPVMGANELLPEIRRRRPKVQVLLTSGYSEEEAKRLCAAYGATGFIQKPYTAKQIAEVVENLIRQAQEPLSAA